MSLTPFVATAEASLPPAYSDMLTRAGLTAAFNRLSPQEATSLLEQIESNVRRSYRRLELPDANETLRILESHGVSANLHQARELNSKMLDHIGTRRTNAPTLMASAEVGAARWEGGPSSQGAFASAAAAPLSPETPGMAPTLTLSG